MFESIAKAWGQSPLRHHYEALGTRERRLVIACLVALSLALAYAGGAPLFNFHSAAIERYANKQNDLQWMKKNRRLAETPGRLTDRAPGSQARMSTINAAAKNLDLPLRRIQPETDGFSVQIEAQKFEDVIRWSHALESRHGIEITNVNISVQDPGIVNARFSVR